MQESAGPRLLPCGGSAERNRRRNPPHAFPSTCRRARRPRRRDARRGVGPPRGGPGGGARRRRHPERRAVPGARRHARRHHARAVVREAARDRGARVVRRRRVTPRPGAGRRERRHRARLRGAPAEPRTVRRPASRAARGRGGAPARGPAVADRATARGRFRRRGRGELMAELRDVLRSDPYLAELGDDDLGALEGALEVEEVESGAVLVRSGETPEALMLLVSGDVDAELAGEKRRLEPGSWLGGFAGIEAGGRLMTV